MEEDSTLTLDSLIDLDEDSGVAGGVTAAGQIEPLRPYQLVDLPIDPRELCTLTIGEPDWQQYAIEELNNDSEVVLIDPDTGALILVSHYNIRYPRRPTWPQLRAILTNQGVRVPRVRWSR
jgi:hypothetical protein